MDTDWTPVTGASRSLRADPLELIPEEWGREGDGLMALWLNGLNPTSAGVTAPSSRGCVDYVGMEGLGVVRTPPGLFLCPPGVDACHSVLFFLSSIRPCRWGW